MEGERLASLKAALTALTGADATLAGRFQRFHDREEVTLLPFSTRPGTPATYVVPPSKPEAELARIRAFGQSLTAGGATAIYDSLADAYTLAARQKVNDDRFTSIVLMSDGESNKGAPAALPRVVRETEPGAAADPGLPDPVRRVGERRDEGARDPHPGKTFDARTQSLSQVFGEIRGYQ